MAYLVVDLSDEQAADIENRLNAYDEKHMGRKITGNVSIGIVSDGRLIAGADGCMTVFRIFYVSTVYVDENHRGKGIGRKLMQAVEERAKALGANMIRLDTFDWQGAEFYRKLGYEEAGMYKNEIDGFAEFFFVKRI